MKNSNGILQEEHRFVRYEVLGLLVFFILGLTYSILRSVFFHSYEESMLSLFLTIAFIGILTYLLILLTRQKLTTRVNHKTIKISTAPLFTRYRKIKWKEVLEIRDFEIPVGTEWSGWMVTFGNFKDYCISRHKGVLLTLQNGEQIFIQTDKPGKFLDIFEKVKGK
jgi:hypothetical protein